MLVDTNKQVINPGARGGHYFTNKLGQMQSGDAPGPLTLWPGATVTYWRPGERQQTHGSCTAVGKLGVIVQPDKSEQLVRVRYADILDYHLPDDAPSKRQPHPNLAAQYNLRLNPVLRQVKTEITRGLTKAQAATAVRYWRRHGDGRLTPAPSPGPPPARGRLLVRGRLTAL